MISTIMITVAIIVLVVMALIAIKFANNVSFLHGCCVYAGVILLGFGGSKWTSDIAINYLRTVLSIGIQFICDDINHWDWAVIYRSVFFYY